MLVTNPANRATLSEVMSHAWMTRGFNGPPAIHLVHREPLRADELDRQVIKGMKGFEFGTEDEIERKLVHILESDAYIRSVQHWERKRSTLGSGLNGASSTSGGRWGESLSNSSLAISFDSATGKNEHTTSQSSSTNGRDRDSRGDSSSTKKSRRFSGFDYYRRKLFSPASSPPGSPHSHSPNPSHPSRNAHSFFSSFADNNQREPPDPTRGFHPLISMYYLAREKMERERVYGPGHFASSQLSILGASTTAGGSADQALVGAASVTTPTDEKTMRRDQTYTGTTQPHYTSPAVAVPPTSATARSSKDPVPSAKARADYSMPLPRLPAPETSHYSGMSYDNNGLAAPSPTSPSFAQPRPRDLGLPPPSPSVAQRYALDMEQQQQQIVQQQAAAAAAGQGSGTIKRALPKVPAPTSHKRSHSMSQRPTVPLLGRGWFGGGPTSSVSAQEGLNEADEYGRIPEGPKTVGPDTTTFPERPPPINTAEDGKDDEMQSQKEKDKERHGLGFGFGHRHDKDEPVSPSAFSSGATLVRKFGSMLVGSTRSSSTYVSDEARRGGSATPTPGRKGVVVSPSPRPSGGEEEEKGMAELLAEQEVAKAAAPAPDTPAPNSGPITAQTVLTPNRAPNKPISASISQPTGGIHRRAATVLDPQSRAGRHERRSSTGAAFMGVGTGSAGVAGIGAGGTIGRNRRPSTGYGNNGGSSRPLTERLFARKEEGEIREGGEEEEEAPEGTAVEGESFKDEEERHGSEKDFKPVFLKGLFRFVTFFSDC